MYKKIIIALTFLGLSFAGCSQFSSKYFEPAGHTISHLVGSATLLEDGTILVIGEVPAGTYSREEAKTKTVQIYDPRTQKAHWLNSTLCKRSRHSATLLNDGRVFIFGAMIEVDSPEDPCFYKIGEVYNPKTQSSEAIISKDIDTGSEAPPAIKLPNGHVLIMGAYVKSNPESVGADNIVEFDPKTNQLTPIGLLKIPRTRHSSVLLPDGSVLTIGGEYARFNPDLSVSYPIPAEKMEVFDYKTRTSKIVGKLKIPKEKKPAVFLLPNNKVLIAGGFDSYDLDMDYSKPRIRESGIEELDLGSYKTEVVARFEVPKTSSPATMLPDGRILFIGGGTNIRAQQNALYHGVQLYNPATKQLIELDRLDRPVGSNFIWLDQKLYIVSSRITVFDFQKFRNNH